MYILKGEQGQNRQSCISKDAKFYGFKNNFQVANRSQAPERRNMNGFIYALYFR